MDGNRLEFLFKMPLDIDLKRLLCHTPASDLLLLYDKRSNSNFEYVETIDGMIVKKKVLGKEIADRLRSLLEHTNLKISAFM